MISSLGVLLWWAALSCVAALNIALWLRSARAHADIRDDAERRWWRRQRLLSAAFVFGCAFRSVLPRTDIQRLCLYDSWLSTVLLGRSVATIAELSLVTQLALHLHRIALEHQARMSVLLAQVAVPIIVVAECCSWYAVVTRNYLGNACEETLWATTAAVLLSGYALVHWRTDNRKRSELRVLLVAGTAYLLFMGLVDIPMYVARWHADQLACATYLTPMAGLRDLAQTWVVSRRMEDWRSEMPWMSLYFSVAVWISIALGTPPAEVLSPAVPSDREATLPADPDLSG